MKEITLIGNDHFMEELNSISNGSEFKKHLLNKPPFLVRWGFYIILSNLFIVIVLFSIIKCPEVIRITEAIITWFPDSKVPQEGKKLEGRSQCYLIFSISQYNFLKLKIGEEVKIKNLMVLGDNKSIKGQINFVSKNTIRNQHLVKVEINKVDLDKFERLLQHADSFSADVEIIVKNSNLLQKCLQLLARK